MKKIYEKPVMLAEEFTANEYCVNCSTDPDHQFITYNFLCNAGDPAGAYAIHNASHQSQTLGGHYVDGGISGGWFHCCDETHTLTVKKGDDLSKYGVYTGLHIDRTGTPVDHTTWDGIHYTTIEERNKYAGCTPIPVTVWVDNTKDIHCTTIAPENWTSPKS